MFGLIQEVLHDHPRSLHLDQQRGSRQRDRLEKDIGKEENEIKGMAGSLANPNFADKAPAEVVAECKANLAEAETQADLARRRLQDLD